MTAFGPAIHALGSRRVGARLRRAGSRCHRPLAVLAFALALAPSARGGSPEVLHVAVRCATPRLCRFDVTVRHADRGWDHYADRWEVLAPDGSTIAVRVLRHPHVEEQPFTRSLAGVRIPPGVDEVKVRAHDKVHGYGPSFTVRIPSPASQPGQTPRAHPGSGGPTHGPAQAQDHER